MTTHPSDHLGHPTLSPAEVRRLASHVARALGEVDPAIVPPKPEDYRAETHWAPYNYYGLSVEVDVGRTVLTLLTGLPCCREGGVTEAFLEHLAEDVRVAVVSVLRDEDDLADVADAERAAKAKIKRDRLDLEFVSAGFRPLPFGEWTMPHPRELVVRVRLLDDFLLPYVHRVNRNTPRTICACLKELGLRQARRLGTRERLAPVDGVLELRTEAEFAIRAAGRDVGEVVEEMIEKNRHYGSRKAQVSLEGSTTIGPHVGVVCQDGVVGLTANLPPLDWSASGKIVVAAHFPEAVVAGLVGRPLSALVDHPLLMPSAKIAHARSNLDVVTILGVEDVRRPILRRELPLLARCELYTSSL